MNRVRRQEPSPVMKALPWVLLVVVIVIAVVWKRPGREPGVEPGEDAAPSAAGAAMPDDAAAAGPSDLGTPAEQERERLQQAWTEATGLAPRWPDDFDAPSSCEEATSDLEALCDRLDQRPYVRDQGFDGGVFGLIVGVSNDLEAKRPTVGGELQRPESVRDNITHLYRVLGKKRLLQLAELVALEPDIAEPMALTLYRWMLVRERCEPGAPRGMGFRAQYDYAGFLINTVGGQSYLRRRSPELEALASLYSVLILDRAVESGYNPSGVDLRREIERARELVETQPLLFRDRYLAELEEVRRHWDAKSSR